jgi:coenzyme F420-reducing hydrogenase gamma subunit
MKYLGIESQRPKIGVFDFTGCEGCQLQLANKEETLAAFLSCIDVVCFREISSASGEGFTIALVEGAISREDEVERIQWIREQAEVLVALGSCACFGGVNRLKNDFDLDEANREVYGDQPKPTLPVRAINEVVPVDLEIPGCPVSKAEVERVVQHLIWEVPFRFPAYPVCLSVWDPSPVPDAMPRVLLRAWAAGAVGVRPRNRISRSSSQWREKEGSAKMKLVIVSRSSVVFGG